MKVKIQTSEGEQELNAVRIEIQIGENTYFLNESVNGKLNVNKLDGNISVHPRYANVVELL